ncbi:MAG TPA: endonuclease/exonuclease/phosphatase family protein [Phycisphaerae bacterium]|nr:endonuclease/exonuclease/phosphatase family protein [Phycisphaerae bacterium]
MMSSPLWSRRERFGELDKLLRTLQNRQVVVMGDFNTPPDSTLFNPMRGRFDNAFEAADRGLHVTWPVPLPVLAIDQIWISRPAPLADCHLGWSARSDHRPVIVDLSPGCTDPSPSRN